MKNFLIGFEENKDGKREKKTSVLFLIRWLEGFELAKSAESNEYPVPNYDSTQSVHVGWNVVISLRVWK